MDHHNSAAIPVDQRFIFSGTPSPLVHLPGLLQGVALTILWLAVFAYLQERFELHAALAWLPVIVIAAELVFRVADTLVTQIEIDHQQIVLTEGLFESSQSTLDLMHVHEVRTVSPWWQQAFNIGTVILMTTDVEHPVWRLYGMRQPQQLCERLSAVTRALRAQKGIRPVQPLPEDAP